MIWGAFLKHATAELVALREKRLSRVHNIHKKILLLFSSDKYHSGLMFQQDCASTHT